MIHSFFRGSRFAVRGSGSRLNGHSLYDPGLNGDALMTTSVSTLKNLATQLRIDSVRSTSEAGSGHPTSCLSAAEIVSALFFAEMHFDPKNPQNPDNDRFVLSKGHAAPILYAAWAEAGLFPREELLKLRIDPNRMILAR